MKFTTTILLLALSLSLLAQNNEETQVLTNKKGVPILPIKGDWALGISAQPFLEYAGNLLTSGFNPAPVFTSSNPGYLFAKYYISDNTAIRGNLSIGLTSNTQKYENLVDNNLIDKYKESAFSMGISLGIEKYKNFKNRLRGYYGVDAGIDKRAYRGLSSSGQFVHGKYTFYDAENKDNDYQEVGGNTYTIAAHAFIGVEYFFAPKISISGEFGAGAYGAFLTKREYIPQTGDNVLLDAGNSSFGFATNTTSMLNIFFYF